MVGTRFAFITALAAALFATACSNPSGPPGNYGSVAGVVSSSTSQPISGAQVCIFVVECVLTAADGSYKITTVPSDPAGVMETVTASATGYTSASQQVHIAPGQQTPANFTLTHT